MKLYGIVAEFVDPVPLLAAARDARERGYSKLDAYTPYHVDGLVEELGMRWNPVALIVLLCAIAGGTTAYVLQAYSAIFDYPLNVGGRPLHSWPSFVPITFELTVLFAAVGGLLGMLFLNRLPQPYHPIFNTPHFAERSGHRFYLCVESNNEYFRAEDVRCLLDRHQPVGIWEVPK